jgi:hypothetical protein
MLLLLSITKIKWLQSLSMDMPYQNDYKDGILSRPSLERLPGCLPNQLGRHHGAIRLSRVPPKGQRVRVHLIVQACPF